MTKKNKPLRAKLIANPGAGKVSEAAKRLEQVIGYLLEYGVDVDVALAQPKKEAIPIARRAVKDGYDIVIAMGGDGTLGTVIRGIAGSKIRLGIIAAGTENDIAKSLGIPGALRVIAPEPGAGAEKAPKNSRAESREPALMVSES